MADMSPRFTPDELSAYDVRQWERRKITGVETRVIANMLQQAAEDARRLE